MNYHKYLIGPYNLHIIKTNQFKKDVITIDFRRKTKKEEITLRNFLSNILIKSTNNYPTERLMNIKREELYDVKYSSGTSISGNNMILYFEMQMLNEKYTEKGNFEKSFLFLMDMLFHPNIIKKGFQEEQFLLAKEEIKNNIESITESANGLATLHLLETMDKKSPFSFRADGYLEDLEKITPNKLYKYYLDVLQSDTVDIYIAGNVDVNKVKKLVTEYFFIKTIKKPIGSHFLYHDTFRKRAKTVIEKTDFHQSQLRIGLKLINLTEFERKYVLNIYNYILGGGPDSLLFKVVREKNSLCYSISSHVSKVFNIMTIKAGINAKDFKKAVKLIRKELKNMENGKFTEEDIEKAKTVYTSSFLSILDSPSNLIGLYEACEYFDWDLVEERIMNTKKVTKEMVLAVSKKIKLDTIYLLEGEQDG